MKKKREILTLFCFLLICVMIFALACEAPEKVEEAEDTVLIALIAPLTGPATYEGELLQAGFWQAVEDINANGGILGGKMIEGKVYDEGDEIETAVSSVRRAVEVDGAKALVGFYYSHTMAGVQPVAKELNVPMLTAGGADEALLEGAYYGYFKWWPSITALDDVAIRWIEEQKVEDVVLIWQEDMVNRTSNERLFQKRWGDPDSPIKILDTMWYPFEAVDLSSEYAKAVALNPDLIWAGAWTIDTVKMALELPYEYGYDGIVVAGRESWSIDAVKDAGEVAEGIYQIAAYWPDESIPEAKEFAEKIRAKHGENFLINTFVAHSYDQTIALALAMDAAGTDSDMEKIADEMYRLDYTLVDGTKLKIREDSQRLQERAMVTQVIDGEIKVVDYMDIIW